MDHAQLYKFLKDRGYTLRDIAEKTGYHYPYVCEILNGTQPLSDTARLRFARTFPETAQLLLPELVAAVGGTCA